MLVAVMAFFAAFSTADSDNFMLEQLEKMYKTCETSPASEVFDCKKAAHHDLIDKYCRLSAGHCKYSLLKTGFDFLSPKRCEHTRNCVVVGRLENRPIARLSISAMSSKCGEAVATQQSHDGLRAELTDPYLVSEGEYVTYYLKMKLPPGKNLETSGGSLVVLQFKAQTGYSPPFAIRLKSDGRLVATIRHNRGPNGTESYSTDEDGPNGHQIAQEIDAARPEAWQTVAIRLKTGAEGDLRLVVDGKTVWNYHGPLGYIDAKNYFKMGPYDYTCTQNKDLQIDYSDFARLAH